MQSKSGLKLSSLFSDCYEYDDQLPTFKLFIGGRWVDSESKTTLYVDSPIDDAIVAWVQKATGKEAERAVEAAHKSRNKIRDIAAIERIEILNRARHIMDQHKDDFINTLVQEAGKTVSQATGELRSSLQRIKLTLEEARMIFGEYVPGDWAEDTMAKFALVIREPVGLVACITPFNYPLFSTVAKVVPALISGNVVVIKPSSDDPVSSILFVKVLQEAGVPDGSVNLITGSGKEVGASIASHPLVRMITLTGSTETGREIAKVSGMKRLHLELGGKGSAIIAKDADLELSAEKVLEGSLKYSGQRCDAISRVFVEEPVSEQFLSILLHHFDKEWKLGDPRDDSTTVGPLINKQAAERVQRLVDDAVRKGAKLLRGGKHHACYFEPTLLYDVPLDAEIAWEETFGPVVSIINVKSIDEAIELTNKSRYGLDSCVFTNNFYTAWKVAKALEEGSVSINDAPSHGVGYFPFGGNKDSGLGREGVGYSIDEMTRIKTIQFNLAPAGLGKRRNVPRM